MKIKFPEKIDILSSSFKVIQDINEEGGSFNFANSQLIIGTRYLKSDPNHVFNIICHEVSEICHVVLNLRYNDHSVSNNYKFFMDHKEFEIHNSLFAITIQNFIK